ncbi:MAG: post-COAP-1 domain-containing protein [Woeseiaceae bacterium]
MKRTILALLVGIILISAGCHLLGGGGWLPGLYGGKAHFGFSAECYEEDGEYLFHRGEFQYMDKSAGVRFHGEFEALNGVFGWEGTCAELTAALVENEIIEPNVVELSGTCRTQPKGYEGTFTVLVEDNGQPGIAGDYLEVSTEGCGEDGGDYAHAEMLGGGNIWVKYD